MADFPLPCLITGGSLWSKPNSGQNQTLNEMQHVFDGDTELKAQNITKSCISGCMFGKMPMLKSLKLCSNN